MTSLGEKLKMPKKCEKQFLKIGHLAKSITHANSEVFYVAVSYNRPAGTNYSCLILPKYRITIID